MNTPKKITELTEQTSHNDGHEFAVVPTGTGGTKKITARNILGGYGSYYISTHTATAIASAGTYQKVGSTATTAIEVEGFTHSTNRLTYNGQKRKFRISVVATVAYDTMGLIGVAIAKNGSVVTSSIIEMDIDTSGSKKVVKTEIYGELNQGDFIEVWCTGDTTPSDLTFHNMIVTVQAL